ncbi:MAG: radical SAM protein [Clostridiales Family XIII bacterium]|jgi:anaerobic ribonucleoside-triphosphate reductase activating protein|nr:radical SAM protein [Clostridiales Family XIII bacterium]
MSPATVKNIRVAGIVNDSIVDGPGLRLTVFLQGCDKNCAGCHNPETRAFTGGVLYTPSDIFERIEKNPLLSGVTFSGGEPLLQAEALLPLAKRIKDFGLTLAIYTGDVFEDILEKGDPHVLALLSVADTLIDGPFILSEKSLSLPFRGSSNQRILDVPTSLQTGKAAPEQSGSWNL